MVQSGVRQLINDKAVYRTAPATPGLLITSLKHSFAFKIAELQIEPNQNHLLTNLEGPIIAWLLFVVRHADDSSDVTLAFEDADW